jgi:hypothetical protein
LGAQLFFASATTRNRKKSAFGAYESRTSLDFTLRMEGKFRPNPKLTVFEETEGHTFEGGVWTFHGGASWRRNRAAQRLGVASDRSVFVLHLISFCT